MILCLSSSFLLRVRMQWKPDLRGFLIGDRNRHFFYPDSIIETAEISPATIDAFLTEHGKESMQLLGFFSPSETPFLPGYAELTHAGEADPARWNAKLHWIGEGEGEKKDLAIVVSL